MVKTKAAQSSNSANRQNSSVHEASIQLLRKGFLPNLLAGTENELLDPALHGCLQLLEKKDIGTRLKALGELENVFLSYDVGQLLLIAPYWARMFSKMLANSDYRVRMACLIPHASLVTTLKDKFNPYLKQVAGAWYVAQFDSHPSVAKQATLSMQSCFPKKYNAFVRAFFPAIMMHAKTMVLNLRRSEGNNEPLPVMPPRIALKQAAVNAVESTESKDQSREQRQHETYTGLNAMRKLFEECLKKDATPVDENSDYMASFTEFLHANFDLLAKAAISSDASVKSALFELLSTLCVNNIVMPTDAQHGKFFAMLLDSLEGIKADYAGSDFDAVAMGPLIAAAWECLAVIMHKQPDIINAYLTASKPAKKSSRSAAGDANDPVAGKYGSICRSLITLVNNSGYGYAARVFPNLLPIVAALPASEIQSSDFWTRLSDAFCTGLTGKNCRVVPAEAVAVVEAYLEIGEHIVNRLPIASVDSAAQQSKQQLVTGADVARCHTTLIGDMLFYSGSLGMVARIPQIFDLVARVILRWTAAVAGGGGGGDKPANRDMYGRTFTSAFWPVIENRLASLYESMQLEERRRKLRAATGAEDGGSLMPESTLLPAGDVKEQQFFAERHAAFVQNLFSGAVTSGGDRDTNFAAVHRMLVLMATGYISTLIQVDVFTIETAALSIAASDKDKAVDSHLSSSRSVHLTKNNFQLLSAVMGIRTGSDENGTFPFEHSVMTALSRVSSRMRSSTLISSSSGDADAQLVVFLIRQLMIPADYVTTFIVHLMRKRLNAAVKSSSDNNDDAGETIMAEVLMYSDITTFLTLREAISRAGVSLSFTPKLRSNLCMQLSKLIADACGAELHRNDANSDSDRSRTVRTANQLRSIMESCLRQFFPAAEKPVDERFENVAAQLDFVSTVIENVICRFESERKLSFNSVRSVVCECLFPLITAALGSTRAPVDDLQKTQQLQLQCRHLCSRIAVGLYIKAFLFGDSESSDGGDLQSSIVNDCLFDPASTADDRGQQLLNNDFVFILVERLTAFVRAVLNEHKLTSSYRLTPQSSSRLVLLITQLFDIISRQSTLPNADELLYNMLSYNNSESTGDAAFGSMVNNLSRMCLLMSEQQGEKLSAFELLPELGKKVSTDGGGENASPLSSSAHVLLLQHELLAAFVRVGVAKSWVANDDEATNAENFRILRVAALRTLHVGKCIDRAEVLKNERILQTVLNDGAPVASTVDNSGESEYARRGRSDEFRQVCRLAADCYRTTSDAGKDSASSLASSGEAANSASDAALDTTFALAQQLTAIRRYALGLRRMRQMSSSTASAARAKQKRGQDDSFDDVIAEFRRTFVSGQGGNDDQRIRIEALEALTNDILCSVEQCCNELTTAENNEAAATKLCCLLNALYDLFIECAHLRAFVVENVSAGAWPIIEQQYGEQYDVFKLWLVELTEFYGPRITALLLNFAIKYFAPLRRVDKLLPTTSVVTAADDGASKSPKHGGGFAVLANVLCRDMLSVSLCRLLSAVEACNGPEINKLYKMGPANAAVSRKSNDLWWSKSVSQLCRCVFQHVRCFFGTVVLPQLTELREVRLAARNNDKSGGTGDDKDADEKLLLSGIDEENDADGAVTRNKDKFIASSVPEQPATRVELPTIIHSIWDAYNDDISRLEDENERQWSLEYYLLSWRALFLSASNDDSAAQIGKLADIVERELTRTTLDRLFTVLLLAHDTLSEYKRYFSTLGGVLQLFNRWYTFADTGSTTNGLPPASSASAPPLEKQLHILAFLLIVDIFRFYPAITRYWFANTLGNNSNTGGSDSAVAGGGISTYSNIVNSNNSSNSTTAVKQIRRQVLDCTRQHVSPILLREEMSLVKLYARGELKDDGKTRINNNNISASTDAGRDVIATSISSVADDEAERITLAAASRARRISTTTASSSTMTAGMDIDDQDGYRKKFSLTVRENVREIVATYLVEQMRITTTIVLPEDFPLSQPAVQTNGIGIDDAKIRSWLLALVSYFRQYNGSVLDGILLWKQNIEKHFQGIEECAICLSIVHGQNGSLPRTPCYKCGKRYHPYCLYRWFKEQEKPTCPLCRTTFTRRRHQQLLNER